MITPSWLKYNWLSELPANDYSKLVEVQLTQW